MNIRHFRDVLATEPMPGVKKRIVIGPDEGAQNFIMRVFEVAPGLTSPDHTHPWEHEVFILAGEGAARDRDGKETAIGEGMALFIPSGEKHCLINKGKDVLRFVCVIPAGME
jgi:quercetin dioxygenase-like cupin family protein